MVVFLKGVCKGQLLCAVGRDGNNQMFPIVWAIVQIKSKFTWGQFFRCLKHDFPLGEGMFIYFMFSNCINNVH